MKLIIFSILLSVGHTAKCQIDNVDTLLLKNDTLYGLQSKIKYSGDYKLYYPGDIKISGKYLDGVRDGEFRYYNIDKYRPPSNYFGRKLDSTITYKEGKRHGLKKIYNNFLNAPYIISIENYSNDHLDGESNYWDFSGQLLSTIEYENGKIKKVNKFQIDTTIELIDYRIKEFPNDTLNFKSYKVNSPLKIELIAFTKSGSIKKITNKGYRIKSVDISRIDQTQTFYSGTFLLKTRQAYLGEDRFFITNVTIIDPNDNEYSLPSRTIMLLGTK